MGFYELLIYGFIALFALTGLFILWNCWLQCCTSEEYLWAIAGGREPATDTDDAVVEEMENSVEMKNASKWQLSDVSVEEFTLIPIPDVRSCGVQTSGTLERAFVARHAPRRAMFMSTQV